MKITVDEDPHASVYIELQPIHDEDIARTMQIEFGSVMVDVGSDGTLLGVEFVNGHRFLTFIQEHGGAFDFVAWVEDHFRD